MTAQIAATASSPSGKAFRRRLLCGGKVLRRKRGDEPSERAACSRAKGFFIADRQVKRSKGSRRSAWRGTRHANRLQLRGREARSSARRTRRHHLPARLMVGDHPFRPRPQKQRPDAADLARGGGRRGRLRHLGDPFRRHAGIRTGASDGIRAPAHLAVPPHGHRLHGTRPGDRQPPAIARRSMDRRRRDRLRHRRDALHRNGGIRGRRPPRLEHDRDRGLHPHLGRAGHTDPAHRPAR